MGRREKVAVIGLGYVGLPLALLSNKCGHTVFGVDVDTQKVQQLLRGASYIEGVNPADIADSSITFTDTISTAKDAKIFILCVPTPVTKNHLPDLKPLRGAIRLVAPVVKPGDLIIVESTVNPGICDDVVAPLIKKLTGLHVGTDIDLVHCPERINPGDKQWTVRNINRVLGGSSPRATKRGLAFYRSFIDADLTSMNSLKEAEAVKVVENSFRDINIAFVNELAMAFHTLGIDLEKVIEGAATKPFSFMPHHPGCGVGGHCIPVDPYYLIDYSRGYGFEHHFLRLARTINEQMPQFTVRLLHEALAAEGIEPSTARIGLLGLSYKPEVGDDRESPAYHIQKQLLDDGFTVKAFDPYISYKSDAANVDDVLHFADALIIATGHEVFRSLTPAKLKKHGVRIIVDGRNILRDRKHLFKAAGQHYVGIGQR